LLPLPQASVVARFLQETSDGADAGFNGIDQLQQVRTSGMHVRCRSRQEVLIRLLRAKRRQQVDEAVWLRLRPLRLQARLNRRAAAWVAGRVPGNYCCRL
jgi:hypothetical protein